MTVSLQCSQGHQWEPASGDPLLPTRPPDSCPVCGDPGQPLAAADLAQAGNAKAMTLVPGSPPPQSPAASEMVTLAPATETATTAPPVVPGYEILGELGRGGMGVVYQARQVGLQRLVALKMLLGGAQADADQLARFRAEAVAVARLHHPHIIQIYEVGEVDGLPFFSLEYIEGGSLADQLDGTPQSPRLAAGLVQTLAEVIHHAHEHRIIHRDLKPANVLLVRKPDTRNPKTEISNPKSEITGGPNSDFGFEILDISNVEPKVTDFGLAKPIERESGLTKHGTLVGTPSYMAPEQAQGRQVGPAVDVYALGSILYEMLTGRPPFRAGTPLDTILQVLNEEPIPPSRFHPKLPGDLETICLKCLEKDLRHRYADAQRLAEDLRRFLAGEPIQARSTGALRRLVKWTKRRPAVAGLIGVSVLAVLVLAGVISVSNLRLKEQRDYALEQKQQADEQRDAATAAKEEADQQRRRAEVSFDRARQAVDQMLTRVGDEKLRNVPLLEELQRDLLEDALKFNKQFLQDSATDPAVRRETGRAYYRVGEIRAMLGQRDEALAAFAEAIKLQVQLVADDPEQPDSARDLALSYQGRGQQYLDLGRTSEAEEAYRETQVILEKLVKDFPERPGYRQELALFYNRQGLLLGQVPRWDKIEPVYRKALDLQEALLTEDPHRPVYRHDRARTLINLGSLFYAQQKWREAEETLRQAMSAQEALVSEFPKEPAYRQGLARTQTTLAAVFAENKRWKEAEEFFRKTIDSRAALVADFPRVPLYRFSLAQIYYNLGTIFTHQARRLEAVQAFRQAQALYDPLVAEFPKVLSYRGEQAQCLNNLAAVLADQGEKTAAEQIYRQAAAGLEILVTDFPKQRFYHSMLGLVLNNLADLVKDQRLNEARQLLERAIQHQQTALKLHPGHTTYTPRLRWHYSALTDVLLRQEDHREAARAAEELTRVSPENLEGDYNAACVYSRCLTLSQKESALSESQRQELTRAYGDRALELLRSAIRKGYKDVDGLNEDKDLDPLRSREDFQKLLKELKQDARTPEKGRLIQKR